MNRPYEIISNLCKSRSQVDINLGFYELSLAINEMIMQGYTPIGGVIVVKNTDFSVTLFQAVYKDAVEVAVNGDCESPQIIPAKKRGRPAKK